MSIVPDTETQEESQTDFFSFVQRYKKVTQMDSVVSDNETEQEEPD